VDDEMVTRCTRNSSRRVTSVNSKALMPKPVQLLAGWGATNACDGVKVAMSRVTVVYRNGFKCQWRHLLSAEIDDLVK
jgi:hypothetical protein